MNKLVCKIFGHTYPLVSLFSSVLAAVHNPQRAMRDYARITSTCQRCGTIDEDKYESTLERLQRRQVEIEELVKDSLSIGEDKNNE